MRDDRRSRTALETVTAALLAWSQAATAQQADWPSAAPAVQAAEDAPVVAEPERRTEPASPRFTTDMVFGKPFTTDMVFNRRPAEAGALPTPLHGAARRLRNAWAGWLDGMQTGHASYYHDSLHGRRTANGERYDRNALTAAHRTLPLGTLLRVVNLTNQKAVLVRVNDRGPYAAGRALDLSRAAASALGYLTRGTTRVRMEVVDASAAASADAAAVGAPVDADAPQLR